MKEQRLFSFFHRFFFFFFFFSREIDDPLLASRVLSTRPLLSRHNHAALLLAQPAVGARGERLSAPALFLAEEGSETSRRKRRRALMTEKSNHHHHRSPFLLSSSSLSAPFSRLLLQCRLTLSAQHCQPSRLLQRASLERAVPSSKKD
jgi:hypothetical protein